jgi:hypothetical protein
MPASPQSATKLDYYLHTDFRPDADYVDGEILERNAGEVEHAFFQKRLLMLLAEH